MLDWQTGETALIIASHEGDIEIVCLLLKGGEDLNTTDKVCLHA